MTTSALARPRGRGWDDDIQDSAGKLKFRVSVFRGPVFRGPVLAADSDQDRGTQLPRQSWKIGPW
jgi:hypothetical protein